MIINGIEYYDLTDLEKKLNLSVITLRNYIKSGKLAAVKIGRKYYVTDADLQQLINLQRELLHGKNVKE